MVEPDVVDSGGGGGGSGVSCSICLELVCENGDRSWAKLQCGHEFHLDCIGSAFNMKGEMQCPNCRKVEKGHWLYANGNTRSFPEFSMDDWIPDEEPYDISFSDMPIRVHWCPYSGLTRIRSSLEEVESPPATYHGPQGRHAIFTEHAAASSVPHSYVAYFGHIAHASSNTGDGVDDPIFNHPWNGISGHNEIFAPNAFPAVGIQYPSWGHHSPPTSSLINSADHTSVPPATVRSARSESDAIIRSGSLAHPFLLGHGSGPRVGSSFVPSVHHPGGNVRGERIQVSHIFHHPQHLSSTPGMPSLITSGVRRFNGPRNLPPALPAPSQSDHSGGFYIFPPPSASGQNLHEAENTVPNPIQEWERDFISHFPVPSFDRDWPLNRATGGGSDSGNRSSSFWQWHWS